MNTELQNIIETESQYLHISIPFYEEDFSYPSDNHREQIYSLVTEDNRWEITIDLKNHLAEEWKTTYGTCHIFSKVRDEGEYTLLDKNKKKLCRLTGYVPNGVIPPKDGYGDYISFDIKENSRILGWYSTYNFSDFINKGKGIGSFDSIPITNAQNTWGILQSIFIPLAIQAFQELRDVLYPSFAYSGEFVYLSKDKTLEKALTIDIELPFNQLEANSKIQKYIIQTKSIWLTFGVSSPKQSNLGHLRFQIAYHIDLNANNYYLPIIDKTLDYGTLLSENEVNVIVFALKNKAIEMLKTKTSGIVMF